MIKVDSRGCAVSGATPEALMAYERALAATLAWRTGARAPLERAIADAPGFVMPLILQAYTLPSAVAMRAAWRSRPGAGARGRPSGQRARNCAPGGDRKRAG